MGKDIFVPLELGLVDKGEFLEQANTELLNLQGEMIKYVSKHKDKSEGAKAKLTLELTLSVEDPGSRAFGIKSQIKYTKPASPPKTAMVIGGQTQNNEDRFFVSNQDEEVEDAPQTPASKKK